MEGAERNCNGPIFNDDGGGSGAGAGDYYNNDLASHQTCYFILEVDPANGDKPWSSSERGHSWGSNSSAGRQGGWVRQDCQKFHPVTEYSKGEGLINHLKSNL